MEARTLGNPALLAEASGASADQAADQAANQAIGQWTSLLGADHVIVDVRSRTAAETATFATTQTVSAIIRPANREELQECVRIANRFRIPVYPVSSGKNWGYGSGRAPAGANVFFLLCGGKAAR